MLDSVDALLVNIVLPAAIDLYLILCIYYCRSQGAVMPIIVSPIH